MNSYITFDNYYNIPLRTPKEEDEKNYEEYGRKLREILLNNILYSKTIITDEDIIDTLKERHVDYIQTRIINLALNIYKNESSKDEDQEEPIDRVSCTEDEKDEKFIPRLDEQVSASDKVFNTLNQLLNLDGDLIIKIHLLTNKIYNAYLAETTKPSSGEKKLIRRGVKNNAHKCYICAREVDIANISKVEERKKCEVEHIFPRVYGGSRNKINLTVCCENCNKIKGENITHNSIYFESCITSSNKEENIKPILTKRVRLSLIMKQNLKCIQCNQRFFKIKDLKAMYAIKKNKDDLFHYFNTAICCDSCFTKNNLKGVKFELQL